MKEEEETNMKEEETKINWDALDEHWKDDYEETYGHLFNI